MFLISIEKREKHPLILLEKYKLGKYMKLPGYIFHKFKKRKISYQHFSGIVRTGLLAGIGDIGLIQLIISILF